MSQFKIKLLSPTNFSEWELLLQKNIVRSFWGTQRWLKALEDERFIPKIMAIFKGNTPVGGMAVMASRSSFIRRGYSAVLASYSPLVLQSGAKRKPQQEAERVKMLDEMLHFAEAKFDYISLSVSPENQEWRPFFHRGWQAQIQSNYWIPQNVDYRKLEADFHPDLRRALKNAHKSSFEFSEAKEFYWMKKIYDYTFLRQNRKPLVPSERLENVWNQIPTENRICFLAKNGDEVAAATAVFCWEKTLYCWQMGRNASALKSDALAWLITEILKRYEHFSFDFNGSSTPSIGRFFRNFGAEHHTYFTFSHFSKSIKGKGFSLYKSIKQ